MVYLFYVFCDFVSLLFWKVLTEILQLVCILCLGHTNLFYYKSNIQVWKNYLLYFLFCSIFTFLPTKFVFVALIKTISLQKRSLLYFIFQNINYLYNYNKNNNLKIKYIDKLNLLIKISLFLFCLFLRIFKYLHIWTKNYWKIIEIYIIQFKMAYFYSYKCYLSFCYYQI